MDLQDKLDLIDVEIAKGLKLRATERLRNMLGHYPDETRIWLKLAELYFEAGFYDAAGKYWILTEPNEERIKKCVEMYEKSVNYSGSQILKDLIFRGDRSKLPEYGQRKLEALEHNSMQVTGSVPAYKRKHFSRNTSNVITEQTFKDKLNDWAFISLLIFILLMILLGFAEGVRTLFNFLFK